jgi:hypothetical protein
MLGWLVAQLLLNQKAIAHGQVDEDGGKEENQRHTRTTDVARWQLHYFILAHARHFWRRPNSLFLALAVPTNTIPSRTIHCIPTTVQCVSPSEAAASSASPQKYQPSSAIIPCATRSSISVTPK